MTLSLLPTPALAVEAETPAGMEGLDITEHIENLTDTGGAWASNPVSNLIDGILTNKFGTNGDNANSAKGVTTVTLTFDTETPTVLKGLSLRSADDSVKTFRNPDQGGVIYGVNPDGSDTQLGTFATTEMTADDTWYSYTIDNTAVYSSYKLELKNGSKEGNRQGNMQFSEMKLFGVEATAVAYDLTNVKATGATGTVNGQDFTNTLTPTFVGGSIANATVTVTVGGTDVTETCYNKTTGVVSIPGASVTGAVAITATMEQPSCKVTYDIDRLTAFDADNNAVGGPDYDNTDNAVIGEDYIVCFKDRTGNNGFLPEDFKVKCGETVLEKGKDYDYAWSVGQLRIYAASMTGEDISITGRPNYRLSVYGTTVADEATSGELGGGTWSFDPDTVTLSLKNITLDAPSIPLISYDTTSALTMQIENCNVTNFGGSSLVVASGINSSSHPGPVTLEFSGNNRFTGFTSAATDLHDAHIRVTGTTTLAGAAGMNSTLLLLGTSTQITGDGTLTLEAGVNGTATNGVGIQYGATNPEKYLSTSVHKLVYQNGVIDIPATVRYGKIALVCDGVKMNDSSWPAGLSWNETTRVLTVGESLAAAALLVEGNMTVALSDGVSLSNEEGYEPILQMYNGAQTLALGSGASISGNSAAVCVSNSDLTVRVDSGSAAISAQDMAAIMCEGSDDLVHFTGAGSVVLRTQGGNPNASALRGTAVTDDGKTLNSRATRLVYSNGTLTASNGLSNLYLQSADNSGKIDVDMLTADENTLEALEKLGVTYDAATQTLTLTGTETALNTDIGFSGDLKIVIADSESPLQLGAICNPTSGPSSTTSNLTLELNSAAKNTAASLFISGDLTVTGSGYLLVNPERQGDSAVAANSLTVGGKAVADFGGKQAVINNGTYRSYTSATAIYVRGHRLSMLEGTTTNYYKMVSGTPDPAESTEDADLKLEKLTDAAGVVSFRLTLLSKDLLVNAPVLATPEAAIDCDGDLELVLTGSTTVAAAGQFLYGVLCDGTLRVSGEGSLKVEKAADSCLFANYDVIVDGGKITVEDGSNGIKANANVIVNGGDVIINGSSVGIYCGNGNVTVNGGSVIISGGEDLPTTEIVGHGFSARGDITVSGGTVDITAFEKGIYNGGNVTISGGNVTVTIKGEDGDGVNSDGNVTVSGGTVDITAGDDGIYSRGNVTISGGNVTVTTKGEGGDGIYSRSDVTISGGSTVDITAGDDGIYSDDGDVAISGSNVTVTAESDGIYSDDGGVTISGGTVTVTAKDEGGIYGDGGVTISSGNVTVTAGGDGIDSAIGDLTISSGNVTVTAGDDGICSDGDLTVSGGTVTVTAPYAVQGETIQLLNNTAILEVTPAGAKVVKVNEYYYYIGLTGSEESEDYATYVKLGTTGGSGTGSSGSSGGGAAAVGGVTVPVSSNEGKVSVSATVSGGVASVTVTDTQLQQVVSNAASTGVVAVDLSGLSGVNAAKLPAALITAANNATGSAGLEITLAAGTMQLDAAALSSINSGKDVTVSVEKAALSTLNSAQKTTLNQYPSVRAILNLSVTLNGAKVTSFNGGKLTVSIPYAPASAQDAARLSAFYVADSGAVTNMGGAFDAARKNFLFQTNHLSTYVLMENDFPFTDVSSDSFAYDAVKWAVGKDITGGTSATTFAPNATCTRAQTVTFLWRAMGSPAPTGTVNPFTDVSADAYYYKAVLWAVEQGITGGTSATTFTPDATVSRAQAVTFLWRAAGKPAATAASPFADAADSQQYYYDAVLWAVSKGVTSGKTATAFAPYDPCTRAQIVTFLFRDLGE